MNNARSTDQNTHAEAYELAPESGAAQVRPTATRQIDTRGAAPVLGYRGPRDDVPARAEPDAIKDFYMPAWLLGGGIVVEVVAAFLQGPGGITWGFLSLGAELLFGTALMLAGMALAAKRRGFSLGPLPTAIFKLAAVAIAPAAAVALLSPVLRFVPLGGLWGAIGAFVFYFALLGALFDLDQSDTWYCVCIIFLLNLAVYLPLLWLR